MKKYNYKLRELTTYCNEKGIKPIELTRKEREMFITEENKKYGYFPLHEKGKCVVCSKQTGYLSHGYEVYICGQECYDVFHNITEEENIELYRLNKEKSNVWTKIGIEQLLELGYDVEGIAERMDCSIIEIEQLIEEMKTSETE
ncbi:MULTISPECIES: hypothetical protein [Bacillus cereus group]|uniref:Uncharacterized protein n=1 Tax=Bacillus thuringiensis TaxID=1428 RepID=A0A9X6ZQ55_BACTU|nr:MULTISPECIES: hypothetical protein [Bacillus cereus group]PFJ29053.1 hypothetical protein COJ15_32840 [Bacillus thuringiensis]PGP14660.1 hypothetical protein COA01_30370 [Bacillus cereus]